MKTRADRVLSLEWENNIHTGRMRYVVSVQGDRYGLGLVATISL